MELGLSLGHASNPKSKPSGFVRESGSPNKSSTPTALDFCMDLSLASPANTNQQIIPQKSDQDSDDDADDDADQVSEGSDFNRDGSEGVAAAAAPVNLTLLPVAPVPRRISPNFLSLPWPSDNGGWENRSGLDVNRPAAAEEAPATNGVLGLTMWAADKKRSFEDTEAEKTSSRASDDDENGLNSRKKLRLSKEQSAFLEESFKQHHTLNPKQKLALAKQLNLRPRQVEVWFQNRRARTKLKQTEVDCEYLKRCCETLTEENRRLHKELQELRALKASSSPFYAQLPPTTLTMCPSCERVSTAALAPPPPPPQPAATSAVTKTIFYTSSAVQTSHPNRPAASS